MRQTFLLSIFIGFIFTAFGQVKPASSPLKLENRILDQANLLSLTQKQSIFTLIKDLETKTGSQLAIVTVVSLNGQPITAYSLNLANQLGLGRKKYKDGILILFSVKEGELRTEVGAGLDKIITNEFATIVNEGIIVPQFRAGNYANGFYNAVKAIKERIEANRNLIGAQK